MKLLQLRIRNLNSLKGEHKVDFSDGPLAETGLFAITGPTGAGKSTILDAITLALYNQTPRSGSVSKNDINRFGSIITRNTDEAWAQLDFGINDNIYRSHWSISRNRNGNLRDYSLELSKQQTDGAFVALDLKKGEVPKENARLIGLNFDQFLRSILLSQGDFARFLKSNANERGELLEKITGTDIYRKLGRACYERRGVELKKLEHLKIQLDGIELLSEEELSAIEKEVKELTNINKREDEQITSMRKQLLVITEQKRLSSNLIKNQNAKQLLEKELAAFEPELEKLKQHEQVLPIKAEILAVVQVQKSLRDKKLDNQLNEKQLADKKLALQIQKKQLEASEKDIVSHKEKVQKMQPVIKEVRNIDSELKVAKNARKTLEEQNAALGKQVNEIHAEVAQKEKVLLECEKEIIRLKVDLEKHKTIEKAGDQIPLLKQQVEAMQTGQQALIGHVKQMEASPTQKNLLESTYNAEKYTILKAAVMQSRMFIDEKKQLLTTEGSDIENLRKRHQKLQEQSQVVDQIHLASKEKNAIEDEKNGLSKERDESSKEHEKELVAFGNVKKAIEINSKHIQELSIRRERELLEAKYIDARQLLKPDEECPLCGSTQHPYVENYKEKADDVDIQLKTKIENQDDLIIREKSLLKQVSGLNTSIESVGNQLKVLDIKSKACANEIKKLISDNSIIFEDASVEAVLTYQMKLKDDLQKLSKQIVISEQLERAIIRNKEFEMLSSELKALLQLGNELDEQFLNLGFDTKSQSYSVVVQKLDDKYKNIVLIKERLLETEKNQLTTKESWKELGKQLKVVLKDFAEQSEKLNELKEEFESKSFHRKSLLGEKLPETLEQELLVEKESLEKIYNGQLVNVKELSTLIKSLLTRQGELAELIEQSKEQWLKKDVQLNEVLKEKKLSSGEQALSYLLEENVAEKIRKRQYELTKLKTELSHSYTELSDALLNIKADFEKIEITEEELKKLLENKASEQKVLLGKRGSLIEKLVNDKRSKEKQKEKVAEINNQQKEFNRWNELSSLIGDAAGNKFSRFAQELTLRQVLHLANKHLKLLSDRYIVKHVKDDGLDELFIVDTYHGNAERSVKTLSGGESFLVSLSLALGLSDLAGQNTMIGSLFIDEGFGTLDQTTLDVALSALEKLQSETNRTIGIISHVPALKERVTTQIELKKDASGYSTLELRT
ncbi:AAA family ATPase [Carboxylicivirga marina]|uniref:AAA family ATPase n=1 Tax=Carboxylicivirga marina TaxID=2800988 RepID=UPI002595494F|nr:SbcC/MukB-like Walker B domain-containing protein [uncultured Carboxylicivirga sp.]